MDFEAATDEGLMKRVCARDVDAFRILYFRYELRIFNFVLRCSGERTLAEDLLQEVFWRVWRAARTFDPSRGGFRTWLYRVALNTTRNELGLKRYACEDRTGFAHGVADHLPARNCSDDPATSFERRETGALVAAALARLSPTLREIVALRCMEGMKFSEIAALTGAPEGTLRTRFHRAVAELRRRLAPGEQ